MFEKKGILTAIGLAVFGVVIVLPPLVHSYVYPNIGDDSAGYLAIFDSMQRGIIKPQVQYLAYWVIGYPLAFLGGVSGIDIDPLFLWFNYAALIGVGITLYFVVSRLVNRLAGWLAVALVLFCAQGVFFQFYYGQVFNLINIGIILPWLVFFAVKYFIEGGKWWLGLAVLFVALYGSFHTSGIYLPVMAAFGLLCYAVYGFVCKRKIERRILHVGGVMVGLGLLSFALLVSIPTLRMMTINYESPVEAVWEGLRNPMVIPLGNYFMSIVSPSVLVIFALLVIHAKETLKSMNTNIVKLSVAVLVVVAVVLAVSAFGRLSLDPWRQGLDWATIFALLVAVLTGILWKCQKTHLVMVVVLLAVAFGLYHNLPTWFGYNSAMKPVDMRALAYADSFETFSCSGSVAPWIYYRFTKSEWVASGGDIVIMRSKPMTPRSTEDNMWYQYHGWEPDDSYELAKTFTDGSVGIEIYQRKDEHEK